MARDIGIGMVFVKHSNHSAVSAWIMQQAPDANITSLVFTNSTPALAVWDGKPKLMGVSPIVCGASPREGRPFILDVAPTVAARDKIYKALRRKKRFPGDWALDKDGGQTQDSAKALEGVMLPAGGPKESAIAIMMDVFSRLISGSAFAGHVTNPYNPSEPTDAGHFLVATKPDLFMSIERSKSGWSTSTSASLGPIG